MKRYEIGDIYDVKLRKPEKETTKRWKLHRLVVITASQLPEKRMDHQSDALIISPSSLRIHYENQTSASDSFPALIIPLCYYRRFIDVVI